MDKVDVKNDKLLKWDDFATKKGGEALETIYGHAELFSKSARSWYWESIRLKRLRSTFTRGVSYLLGVCGVVAPLLAALGAQETARLRATQLGVAALAVAASIQIFDKVFGGIGHASAFRESSPS